MSFFARLNPSKRGEPSKLWVMSETAPFQVPVTVYFFIVGITNLLSGMGVTPSSVTDTYPVWLVLAWAITTALGSALALLGRYMQTFRMEASGLGFLLSACGIYVGAVLWVNGINAVFASLAYVAIGTGCAIRMRVIARHHKAQKVAGQMIHDDANHGDSPS